MILDLPIWISILFIACFFYTILIFHYSNGKPWKITFLIIIWSIFHSILAYNGFYHETQAIPPRYALVLIPVAFVMIFTLTKKRTWFNDNRNNKVSIFLHAVRLPIEIVLHQLFIFKIIPQLMTYEGYNFDIIMGITAILVGILYAKGKLNHKLLILWNMLGIILIFTILILAILSTETLIQQFAFDQPNVAVNHFPFILLPATIVPLVIWTHISDIIYLNNNRNRS